MPDPPEPDLIVKLALQSEYCSYSPLDIFEFLLDLEAMRKPPPDDFPYEEIGALIILLSDFYCDLWLFF